MASIEIHKHRTRESLAPRRDPYYSAPLAPGLFLGFRRLAEGGTWIARQREDQRQHFQSLGNAHLLSYDDAVVQARQWAKRLLSGVQVSDAKTVADICRLYVEDRRREKGEATATDARRQFAKNVYGHALGKVKLDKLRTAHLKDWRAGLAVSDASKNRLFSSVRAALNYGLHERHIDPGKAIEWRTIKRFAVSGRRDTYLDRDQRRALIAGVPAEFAPLLRCLCLLPLRPGAAAALHVRDFNARAGTLTISKDKAGQGRTLALSDAAAALLKTQAKHKTPSAYLFAHDDGQPLKKTEWGAVIRDVRGPLGLPPKTCAYSLRHSTITDLLTAGTDSLTVSRISGTSLQMIEQSYGHLLHGHAKTALAGLAL